MFPTIDGFVQDVRFAVRMLARERGFAITSILVLGLGIGVNNMMFTLIYGSTMRGLPIPERDRVLHVSTVDQRFPDRPLTYPEFSELRDQARSFEGLARLFHRAGGGRATKGALPIGSTRPISLPTRCRWCAPRRCSAARSRTPTMRPGADPVAILGAAAWRSRYASDPSVLGRTILVDGRPTTVIGVMPDPSRFPSTAEIWLPLSRMPGLDRQSTQTRQLRVFGRVAPGVAAADAQAEIETLFAAIVQPQPVRRQAQRARRSDQPTVLLPAHAANMACVQSPRAS